MNQLKTQVRLTPTSAAAPSSTAIIQRKCACGVSSGLSGECEDCQKKKLEGNTGARLQTKLAIAAPGDRSEQEADLIARHVMDGEVAQHRGGEAPRVHNPLRRSEETAAVPAIVDSVLHTPGEPLDNVSRSFFESRFGHDFGSIRVHADPRAAESARAVDARAYAVGHHLVFDTGEYAPATETGKWLLAHELTHTVQQGAAPARQDATDRAPLPPITRSQEPRLSRWKIEGTQAVADKDGESLKALARRIGAETESWRCIRPMRMALATKDQPRDFNEHYDRYVSATDRFDLSNLLISTGPSLRMHILTGPKAPPYISLMNNLYPGLTYSNDPDSDPDFSFFQASNQGVTPIRQVVLVGHASDSRMMGDPDNGAGTYSPAAAQQDGPDPEPSYDRTATGEGSARDGAKGGAVPMLPRRCWFTRDASVRAVGCNSVAFGVAFAQAYLRRGASVLTTTASVRGVCEDQQCLTLEGLDFAESWDKDSRRLEGGGPFYNTADFHGARYWATVGRRGVGGSGIVQGKEGHGQRPASAVLGETGEQQVAAIRDLLSTSVSDREVRDVLIILRSWYDEDRIAAAWLVVGDHQLRRFLNNLEIEHFEEFPLEVLASVAALDERAGTRTLLRKTRGITSRRDAARAFFQLMDLDPADEEQVAALLGQRPARADRRQARIVEKIQEALPLEVRKALVEAVGERQLRDESAEKDAFSVVLGEFSHEAAGEVVRQVEEHVRARVIPHPDEEREIAAGEPVVPTAEFLYVAVGWLTERGEDQMIGQIHAHLADPKPWAVWVEWTMSDGPVYMRGIEGEQYTLAMNEVLASAVTPSSDLIVNSLSGKHVSHKEARDAFGGFACLLGLPADKMLDNPLCAGVASDQSLVRGTVQRLEELQALSPWLERLFRTSSIDTTNPTNADVLKALLASRLPALALSHVMALLKADQKKARVPPEDSLLARFIIEAQPPNVQEAMRRELAAHATGDLTQRLVHQPGADEARAVVEEDESLAEVVDAIDGGRLSAADLLSVLTLQQAMTAHIDELDTLGKIDELFALFVIDGSSPDIAQLRQLLAARDPLFNVASLQRLLEKTKPAAEAARLAYEIQRALPAEERDLLLRQKPELWKRLTANLPGDVIAQPTFGPALDLSARRDFLRASLDDASLWVAEPDGQVSPTLRTLLLLTIQAGIAEEMVDLVGKYWDEKLSAGLGELGFEQAAVGGPVTYHPRAQTQSGSERRLSLAAMIHLGLGWAVSGPVTVSADRLAEFLTSGRGIEPDVEHKSKSKDEEGQRAGTVTIDWLDGGILQVVGSELVLRRSDTLLSGLVVRTGSGQIRDLEIRYKWNEKKDPDDPSSLAAGIIELTDIVVATEDEAYGIGRIRLTGVAATGDLATGRPFYPYPFGPRVNAMSDLFFSIFDGVLAVISLVQERLMAGGEVTGAEALAAAIAGRFERRLALNFNASGILIEGLVVPGKGTVDRVTLGSESDGGSDVQGVALAVGSPIDWDRLAALQARALDGDSLSDDERRELNRLAGDSLVLAVGVDLRAIEVDGIRTVMLDDSGRAALRVKLEQFEAERLKLDIRISADTEDTQAPSELASLARMDSGTLRARIETLTAFVDAPKIQPGTGVAAAGMGAAGGGSLESGRLELAITPDGSLYLTALDNVVDDVALESQTGGERLLLQSVSVGQASVQRLRTQEGDDRIPPAQGFPAPQPGDTLLSLQDITLGGALLTIADLGALMGTKPGASPKPASTGGFKEVLLQLLAGIDGSVAITVPLRIPMGPGLPSLRTTLHPTIELKDGTVLVQVPPATLFGVIDAREFFEARLGITPGVRMPVVDLSKRLSLPDPSAPAPTPPPGMEGKSLSETLEELEAAQNADQATQPAGWLDTVKEYAKKKIVDAAVLGGLEVSTGQLGLIVDAAEIGGVVDLSLQWDQDQSVPVRMTITPQGYLNGTGALVVNPFELASATGTVKGVPVLASRFALEHPVELTGAAELDKKTYLPTSGHIEAPLSGVSLEELRVTIESKKDK